MNWPLRTVALVTTLIYSKLLLAGGPLVIEGPNGHTPVSYYSPYITLHIENGDLGGRTNSEADSIVQQAFDIWNDVPTATVYLTKNERQLEFVDINISNYYQYIPSPNSSIFNADDNLNPVVYDSDGRIIEAFFGVSQNDSIAGFAASIYSDGGSYFDEGYAVINGKISISDNDLKILIAHEIAHFFGLDHSQAAIDNEDPGCASDDSRENYPLMYPYLCRIDGLHADDISAVSALYPAANIYDSYGTLQGRFVDESGNAILGANIWAENLSTGEAISMVSDYLKQGNGYFKLLLPEGSYTLHANAVNTDFYGASSVGPYATTTDDISFNPAPLITQVDYLGENESTAEVISISANQTIEIDFSSVGKAVVLPETNNSSGSGTISCSSLFILLGVLACRRYGFKTV